MSTRSEMVIIAYTLALVLFSLVQAIHNLDRTDTIAVNAAPAIVSEGEPHR